MAEELAASTLLYCAHVWCLCTTESSSHLFLHRKVAHLVWYDVFKWLGLVIVMPSNLFYLFDCVSCTATKKKIRRGFQLVWHTVIWSLWRARNNALFNNVLDDPKGIVEEIKVLTWKWSIDRLKIPPCMFYEWTWNPGDCFSR
jgi:hypothetical protein